jgi:hypothetical protein
MKSIPLLACLAIALAPLAAAGSFTDPEINDIKGDGGTDTLDILSVWIDPSDANNLVFHATFAAAPPALPPVQGNTAGTDACPDPATCVYASLTYVFSFRVLDPNGNATPQFPDYAFSYIAFRDGPKAASIASPVGYADTRGLLVVDGSATASLNGTELTLRIPRTSPFVNLPRGATPGPYRIDHLAVYSLPELCFPKQEVPSQGTYACAPLAKPVAPTASTPPSTDAHWDNAPDAGFGRAFTFPSPPTNSGTQTQAVTTVTQTRTQTVTQTQTFTYTYTYTQNGQTYTYTQTVPPPAGPGTTAPPTTAANPATGAPPATAKKSPAPEVILVLAGVAGLLAVRRRLSA